MNRSQLMQSKLLIEKTRQDIVIAENMLHLVNADGLTTDQLKQVAKESINGQVKLMRMFISLMEKI